MREPWWSKVKRDPATDMTRWKHSDRPGFMVLLGDRQYYLVGIERPESYLTLVATLRFHPEGAPTDFVDRPNLQSAEDCEYFITAALAEFDPSTYRLDASVLRADLEIVRLEAERWREFRVEQNLRGWRTIPEA